MQVSVTKAKGLLTELVKRAEAGDVVPTRRGQAAVRLTPVRAMTDRKARLALIAAVQASAATKVTGGATAERSQDFLYSDDGLPE